MMFPRAILFSLLTFIFVPATLVATGCDDAAPGDDDDDDDDDDTGEGEGEEGEGEEGEGEGEGEFPVTPDARSLCEIVTRGQLNFVGAIAQGLSQGFTSRCSADDEGPAFPEPAEIAAVATQLCAEDAFENNQVFAQAIANGRVSFNIANIEACSALDLEVLEESGAVELPAPCDPATLFVGLQTAGEPCDGEWECAGTLRCEALDIHAQELTCLAPAAAGQPCAQGSADAFGGVFTGGRLAPRTCEANAQCVEFQCEARVGAGAPCESDEECIEGLHCPFGADPQVCVLLGDVGDPCSFDGDCIEELACNGSLECATPVADGATCADGDACEEGCSTCRPTTPGGAVLQCQDRGAAGAACASDDDCRHNFICDVVAEACVAGGTAGDDCVSNDECATGFVCSELDSTCIVQPGLGDECGPDTSEECAGDLVCAAGACRAGNVGDPCDGDDDCRDEDLSCIDNGAASTCGAQPGAGEACSLGGECADGLLCDETECVATPAIGQPCTTTTEACGAGAFCDAGTCVGKKDAGAACVDDAECSGVCANGECSAVGVSCTTSRDFFPIMVLLSSVIPLGRRWRRLLKAR